MPTKTEKLSMGRRQESRPNAAPKTGEVWKRLQHDMKASSAAVAHLADRTGPPASTLAQADALAHDRLERRRRAKRDEERILEKRAFDAAVAERFPTT